MKIIITPKDGVYCERFLEKLKGHIALSNVTPVANSSVIECEESFTVGVKPEVMRDALHSAIDQIYEGLGGRKTIKSICPA